jgi:hypothetical protein
MLKIFNIQYLEVYNISFISKYLILKDRQFFSLYFNEKNYFNQ